MTSSGCSSVANDLDLQRAAAAIMGRYADALDGRDWSLLDRVFVPEIAALYGSEAPITGRDPLVRFIRSFLDTCGPTQHLMGHTAVVGEDRTKTQIRAFHRAPGGTAIYEAIGTYHVCWRREGEELRAIEWRFEVVVEVGDWRSVCVG